MSASLLKHIWLVIFLGACASASKNSSDNNSHDPSVILSTEQPVIPAGEQPLSLTDLPQTQHGGFVLAPGFYESEFKTYCLQPGTPDPRPGDAYLQGPITGHRKDIVESVLLNSREKPEIPQRNIQLLLWSVVSDADFNKLPAPVQADAMKLLTSKQVFQLKGGVMGVIKKVSYASGVLKANSDMHGWQY